MIMVSAHSAWLVVVFGAPILTLLQIAAWARVLDVSRENDVLGSYGLIPQ